MCPYYLALISIFSEKYLQLSPQVLLLSIYQNISLFYLKLIKNPFYFNIPIPLHKSPIFLKNISPIHFSSPSALHPSNCFPLLYIHSKFYKSLNSLCINVSYKCTSSKSVTKISTRCMYYATVFAIPSTCL